MQRKVRVFTYLCGFIGIAIILLAALMAALTYKSPEGYSYSVLNHNISDLGKPYVSQLATFFNWGLRIGGLFLAGFMIGLSFYVQHPRVRIVALPGAVAAVGVIFIGVYPVSEFYYHRTAAEVFFVTGMITFAAFTVVILSTKQSQLAKWLAIPSFIATLAFIAFVLLPLYLYRVLGRAYILGPPGPGRPIFWLPSLLEWFVFLTVAAWVLIVSWYLYRHE